MYWCIQRKKYTDGNYFLAFDSFTQPKKSYEDFLFDATTRFIMRFAAYKASVNFASSNTAISPAYGGADLHTASSAIAQAEIDKANWTGSNNAAVITYKTDAHDVI